MYFHFHRCQKIVTQGYFYKTNPEHIESRSVSSSHNEAAWVILLKAGRYVKSALGRYGPQSKDRYQTLNIKIPSQPGGLSIGCPMI